MSGDFAISQSAPRSAAEPISTSAASATQTQDPAAVAAAAAATSKRPLVNPSLHLDLALNLVVLQFVDNNGDVTTQIPSQKQLKAYQEQVAASGPGGSASRVVQWAQGAETAPDKVNPASAEPATQAPSQVAQTGVAQSYAPSSFAAPAPVASTGAASAAAGVGSASVVAARSVVPVQSGA